MSVLKYAIPDVKRDILRTGKAPPGWGASRNHIYRVCMALSVPPWVTRYDLQAIEDVARYFTRVTGVQYSVDHIIPLQHPLVCGLTTPENLQVITSAENQTKGNFWEIE